MERVWRRNKSVKNQGVYSNYDIKEGNDDQNVKKTRILMII